MPGKVDVGSREACVLLQTGRRIGRLVVLGMNRNDDVVAECGCGGTVAIAQEVWLEGGRYQCDDCDAHDASTLAQKIIADQDTYETLVSRYRGIVDRCTNPKNQNYENYGALGIESRFEDEEHYALLMYSLGWRYGDPRTTDRIDVHGHYEPSNVRLAMPKEQTRNRRNTVVVDTGDDVVALADLAEQHGIAPSSPQYARLNSFVSKTKQDTFERVMGKISELADDEEFA